jgi:hypothetical protein
MTYYTILGHVDDEVTPRVLVVPATSVENAVELFGDWVRSHEGYEPAIEINLVLSSPGKIEIEFCNL